MKCNKCGCENNKINKFCENCGSDLTKTNTKKYKLIVIIIVSLIFCCFIPMISTFLLDKLLINNSLLEKAEYSANKKYFKEILNDDVEFKDVCNVYSSGIGSDRHAEMLYKNKTTNKYFVAGYNITDKKSYNGLCQSNDCVDAQNYVNELFNIYNNIYFKLYEYEVEDGNYGIKQAVLKIIIDPEKYNKSDIKSIEEKIANDYDEYGIDIFFAKNFDKSSFDLYEMFLTSQYADYCSYKFEDNFTSRHKNVFYEETDDENEEDHEIASYFVSNSVSNYYISLDKYIKNKFDIRNVNEKDECKHWYD